MDHDSSADYHEFNEPVSGVELNSWRRGFTPQAEIWNGRMAMFGLAVALIGLFVFHFVGGK